MRTITLELVRHGPAHNQLLSPLTEYLALCENHPAVTLQLPLEHNQMLYRLSALNYRMGKAPREFQLRDTAQLLGELLARIPGLTADMNRRDRGATYGTRQDADGDGATHLRLVLSASELALLPFELALAPIGFPGAGQPLLLQSLRPVTLTRETRRLTVEQVVWPDHPRVLFIVASPPELPAPPAAAHLLALRRALEPWVGTRSWADEDVAKEVPNDRLAGHLKVLTDATVESIEAACSCGEYTHVHILAHGIEYTEGYDTRFGLLLNGTNPMDPADRVSGERLATALRSSRKGAPGQLARPTVVTLASCNSGRVGSVTGVGASIAHALHADGVPLVIASQFPLSYGGSVRMVEILYEGLLLGEDPRRLLIDLRRTLHTQFPDTHDWSSIAAYSSLPPDFEHQLAEVQIGRAQRSIDVALGLADEVVARVERGDRRSRQATAIKSGTTTRAAGEKEMAAVMQRVQESRERLARLHDRLPSRRGLIVALLASSDIQVAELEFETLKRRSSVVPPGKLEVQIWPLLERARELYDKAFRLEAGDYWAVVQYISLSVVMRNADRLTPDPDGEIGKLWVLAEVQSKRILASAEEHTDHAWALGNLIELNLLAPVIDEVPRTQGTPGQQPNWGALAASYAKDLIRMGRPDASETRRQIARYLDFYVELCPQGRLEPAVAIAEQVARMLPEERPEDVKTA